MTYSPDLALVIENYKRTDGIVAQQKEAMHADLSVQILNSLTEEKKRNIATIREKMDGLYEFLNTFSENEKSISADYSNFKTSLKDFEQSMIDEVINHKQGEWRDPINTTIQLEQTVKNVFNPHNDSVQRTNAIGEFEVQARNARFTTKTKFEIAHLVVHLSLIASVVCLIAAPPVGVALALLAISALALLTATALIAQAAITAKKQDVTRGFDVTKNLKQLNTDRVASYGTLFYRPTEIVKDPEPVQSQRLAI